MDNNEFKKLQEELAKKKAMQEAQARIPREAASVSPEEDRKKTFQDSFNKKMEGDPSGSEVPTKDRFSKLKNLFGK